MTQTAMAATVRIVVVFWADRFLKAIFQMDRAAAMGKI